MKTCNYAIVRFRPYRETGEFVNVGVVLFCPETGYFDMALANPKCQRVTDFFPEMDENVFVAGRQSFYQELQRVKQLLNPEARDLDSMARLSIFRELTRPRESLFSFGEPGTVLAEDPVAKLKELFDRYVNRQFAPSPSAA